MRAAASGNTRMPGVSMIKHYNNYYESDWI